MACGNNNVSRSGVSATMPLSKHLATLFDRTSSAGEQIGTPSGQALHNETTRAQDQKIVVKNTRGKEQKVRQKYSAARGTEESLKSGSKNIDESLRGELWKLDKAEKLDRSVDVHRYLDSKRNETLNSQLHIHEILKADGTVTMHVTDRRGGGAAKQVAAEVFLRPVPGNEVNAAEARLAAIMRKMED